MAYNHSTADRIGFRPRKGEPPCLARVLLPPPSFRLTSFTRPNAKFAIARCPSTCSSAIGWYSGSTTSRSLDMTRPAAMSAFPGGKSDVGGNAGLRAIFPLPIWVGGAVRPLFPPADEAQVKAIACETVFQSQQPLSRQSLTDLTRRCQGALGKPISRSTVRRILHNDAIKPWQFDYWIFPRDPQFAQKAERILDLYAGCWEGKSLRAPAISLSARTKRRVSRRGGVVIRVRPPVRNDGDAWSSNTSAAARLQYLAAWDVHARLCHGPLRS